MKIYQNQLKHSLNKSLKPIYFISCEDYFLVNYYVDLVVTHAMKEIPYEKHVFFVDNSFNWDGLYNELTSASLFAKNKLIVIYLSSRLCFAGLKMMEKYCSNIVDDNMLIISSQRVEAKGVRSKWYKNIDNVGVTVQVWPIKKEEAYSFIRELFLQNSFRIEEDAVKLLWKVYENNWLSIKNLVKKLVLLYDVGLFITMDHINIFLKSDSKFNIFDFVDALYTKDYKRAIKIFYDLKNNGVDEILILWVISFKFKGDIDILRRCSDIDRIIKGAEKLDCKIVFEKLIFYICGKK